MQSDFRYPEVPRGSRPDPNRYRMPRRRASYERREREKRLRRALRQAAHLAQLRRVQFRPEDTTPSATPVDPKRSPQHESKPRAPPTNDSSEDEYLQIEGREFDESTNS